MKSQLLISHCFLLIKQIAEAGRRRKNQVAFLEYPQFFWDVPSIFVSIRNPDSARKVLIGRNPSLDFISASCSSLASNSLRRWCAISASKRDGVDGSFRYAIDMEGYGALQFFTEE